MSVGLRSIFDLVICCFTMKSVLLAFLLALALFGSHTYAGPVASAATYCVCVSACLGVGVFAFGSAVVATNGAAAAAALALPGAGMWVSCSSMCTQMCGLALVIPSP